MPSFCRSICRQTYAQVLNYLILACPFQLSQFGIVNPMNAIYWAGIDRFLNQWLRIAILTHDPRSAIALFQKESVISSMGTMTTTNAGSFIHIDSILPSEPPSSGSRPLRSGSTSRNMPPNSGSMPFLAASLVCATNLALSCSAISPAPFGSGRSVGALSSVRSSTASGL
jgi:hypothetical protein